MSNSYSYLSNNFSLPVNFCSKTHCWRADHEIFIQNGKSQSELIFVSARQHVFISNNSLARKTVSILTLYRMKMDGLPLAHVNSLKAGWPEV